MRGDRVGDEETMFFSGRHGCVRHRKVVAIARCIGCTLHLDDLAAAQLVTSEVTDTDAKGVDRFTETRCHCDIQEAAGCETLRDRDAVARACYNAAVPAGVATIRGSMLNGSPLRFEQLRKGDRDRWRTIGDAATKAVKEQLARNVEPVQKGMF